VIFLIEYDRERGVLVSKTLFPAEQRPEAQKARLDLEVRLNAAGVDHEVVLLEAVDEASLRRTHQRYFSSADELSVPAGRS
jgi:hypothetical protein